MRRSEKRKREKKEDVGARKGRKITIRVFFSMICGSRGSKSNLATLWREAHFQVKRHKAP